MTLGIDPVEFQRQLNNKLREDIKCGTLTQFLCEPQPFTEEFGHLIRPGHDCHEGAIDLIKALHKKVLEQRQILRSEALLNTSLHRENLLITSWVKHHQRTVELKMKQVHELEDQVEKLKEDLIRANRQVIESRGVADDFRQERNYWADKFFTLEIETIKA